MSKKCKFLAIVGALSLWSAVFPAKAAIVGDFHALPVGAIPDWVSAGFRALTAAVKLFLGDDTSLIAELVWDTSAPSGCPGCSGCYGNKKGSASADDKLSASLQEVAVSEDVFGSTDYVEETDVRGLARKIIMTVQRERASLNELTDEGHKIYYRAQQRSIQAMTDALVMKKAYKDLKGIVGSLPTTFDSYSTAASAIATRRIILDELMALKKRVIAARLRTKAQTMELESINTESLTTLDFEEE